MSHYVFLHLAKRRFGLPVTALRETFEPGEITPIPWAPDFLQGLLNLRGDIVPLINLQSFLFDEKTARPPRTLHVLIDTPQARFATPVDQLTPRTFNEDFFEPHPDRALYPALNSEIWDEEGRWEILELERLLLFMGQQLKFSALHN